MHWRFIGHQSYVLICSKTTSFQRSEWEFSEKVGIFSKVKIFQYDFLLKDIDIKVEFESDRESLLQSGLMPILFLSEISTKEKFS